MNYLKMLSIVLLLVYADSRYQEQHRPCSFNPLCTCSNGGPDLGSVCCYNIPFMTIPPEINNSAIYIMSLKNNNLRYLADNGLRGTGLWKLVINNNRLTNLPPNALVGLEKTLSVLDLCDNELIRVPKEAIQNLEKLHTLNLAGNHISNLNSDDLHSISKTLKSLDISKNALIHLHNDAFRNMISLEILNLASNVIVSIDGITFQNGLHNLRYINLMNNQLQQIPLNMLANLKNIKVVNLNENLISTISEGREVRAHIFLEELHLEYNLIQELMPESFRQFKNIHRVYLKGNPIITINDTFVTTNVTELYLPHCLVSEISANAFNGIMDKLKVLDLRNNHLQEFPILRVNKLEKLLLAGNEINAIDPNLLKPYGTTLKYFDISGPKMHGLSEEVTVNNLPNIRELVFNIKQSTLNSIYLKNIGPSLENLRILRSTIKIIENGAFQQLSGLKELDLSYNIISKIENSSFKEVGHSLEKLILHNALKMTMFPGRILHYLSKLYYLDISSNRLGHFVHDSFSTMRSLKVLNLNHNELKSLDMNLVSGVNNPNLQQLKIAFNKISFLEHKAFNNLQSLVHLEINDNLIQNIKKSAFMDMDNLITINLEGNAILHIEDDVFQNLPNVQFINLAYNKLQSFNLKAFDQVSRLSTLRIDVDHNNIQNLTKYYSSAHASSNIKILNLSHNNISYIDATYFDPIRLSINVLDIRYNQIQNLTNLAFTDMTHLQSLLLSHNEIYTIELDELKGLKNLQILDLSNNEISDLKNVLINQQSLRIFSAANNKLYYLPKDTFATTILEQLDLSYNEMAEFPESALLTVKQSLQYLDLTGNHISAINFSTINQFQKLRHLSISNNGLHFPDDAKDLHLTKLISLDFSHNGANGIPSWIFNHLPKSLESLNLANNSITLLPTIDAPKLLQLNLSDNLIKVIEPGSLDPLKNIQVLDLSNNLLPTICNNIWSNLESLRSLHLQKNPIQSISNASFSNLEKLQDLFITDLKLQDIQKEAFHELTSLRKIGIDMYPKIKNINLSTMLSKNFGLKEIQLNILENHLEKSLTSDFPRSLKAIVVKGENLKHMDESAFSDVKSKDLILDIQNTNLTRLTQKVFDSMKEVKNFTALFKDNKLQTIERIFNPLQNETPDKYLQHLELSGNELICDCDMAWIWNWIKEYEYKQGCNEVNCRSSLLKGLRETKCLNMNNKSIVDVFKTELDCFSSGSLVSAFTMSTRFIFVIITLYMNIFSFASY